MSAHSLTRRVACVLAAVASIAVSVAVAAAPADAGPGGTVTRGAGASIAHGTDWVGQYRVRSGGRTVIVYCINPAKRQPSRLSLRTVRQVPGESGTVTRELAQVLAAHGQTGDRIQAEATSQALNYLVGNRADVTRRARWLAPSTQRLAMAYVAEARRLRGAWTVRLRLPTAALPGQSGTGTVTVRGTGGARATLVTLRHSRNVSTPRTVRTDARGAGRFTYRTTGAGPVRVEAFAAHLSPVTVQVSDPAAGFQRMVSTSAPVTAHASAAYQARAVGLSHSYRCDSDCAGRPSVTLRACAPASGYAARLTLSWAGGSSVLEFPAARVRACRSVVATVADGRRVSGSWSYRAPGGWTAPLPAPGAFTVDCPPAPPVAVSVSYDCADASFTALLGRQRDGVLTPLRNATRHPMALELSGAVTARLTLTPGAVDSPHSWPLRCGQHARVTVRGSVARAAGGWNSGQPVQVVLP